MTSLKNWFLPPNLPGSAHHRVQFVGTALIGAAGTAALILTFFFLTVLPEITAEVDLNEVPEEERALFDVGVLQQAVFFMWCAVLVAAFNLPLLRFAVVRAENRNDYLDTTSGARMSILFCLCAIVIVCFALIPGLGEIFGNFIDQFASAGASFLGPVAVVLFANDLWRVIGLAPIGNAKTLGY